MPVIIIRNRSLDEDELKTLVGKIAAPIARTLTSPEMRLSEDEIMIDIAQLHPLGVMHIDALVEIKASACEYRLLGGDTHAKAIATEIEEEFARDLPPDRDKKKVGFWIRLAEGGYDDALL